MIPTTPPPFKHPCGKLLERENRKEYIKICVPLYEASMKGDWEAARDILQDNEYLLRYSIHEYMGTILHIAARGQNIKFVKNVVDMMSKDDLELQNEEGNTALCLAAAAGNMEMVKIMVEKNEELLTIRGSQDMMPLHLAALYGERDMVTYLYDKSQKMSGNVWTDEDKYSVFLKCIRVDLFDAALKILKDHENVVLFEDNKVAVILLVLARKPYAFDDVKQHTFWSIINLITRSKVESQIKESEATQLLRKIWTRFAEKPKDKVDHVLEATQLLFVAAELGNVKFLVELIHKYPDIIWMRNTNKQSIFHIAVSRRHHKIYSLLNELGSMKNMITPFGDEEGNLMLHLLGTNIVKNSHEDLSGAAFQMQRELLWFKEVEAMIPPPYRQFKNAKGLTPHELFNESHKDLLSQGEKWMKGTANQCMVVAALITTVVFAVAYTIPGGYDQNNGYPMFLHNGPFITFVILDAVSLILSSASILMFLSILTSRYAQNDFLESLPKKLLVGLATLFLSIMTMMVAFSVSFFVLYHNKLIVLPIIISLFAIIPVFLYAKLEYPLLVDAYRSTYGSKYLFKPKKLLLYYQNPRF